MKEGYIKQSLMPSSGILCIGRAMEHSHYTIGWHAPMWLGVILLFVYVISLQKEEV